MQTSLLVELVRGYPKINDLWVNHKLRKRTTARCTSIHAQRLRVGKVFVLAGIRKKSVGQGKGALGYQFGLVNKEGKAC
ncbi:hypothetical protein D3C77_294400 [compost metagenome]